MAILGRLIGPECPRCGCPDSVVVGRHTWWGKPQESRRCHHCGHSFSIAADEYVELAPAPQPQPEPMPTPVVYGKGAACPQCGTYDTVVYCTKPHTRYHKCKACNKTFKSQRIENN